MGSLIPGQSEAIALLSSATRILITTHTNPDADAIGSSTGLGLALRHIGKEVALVTLDKVPEYLAFLPLAHEVSRDLPAWTPDVIVFCDCGTKARIGDELVALLPAHVPMINLDHHASNDFFGAVNLVESTASSASEVVFNLLSTAGWEITSDCAVSLLAGVVADTGGFRYRSTTGETLRVAAELVKAGASLCFLAEKLFSERPLSSVRLQGLAMQRIKLLANGRVAYVVIDEEMYKAVGANYQDTEGMAENLRDVQSVRVGAVIRWDGEVWRVSLRGKGSEPNLSKFAESFGGGGHIAASAFRWRKSLPMLLERLIPELEGLMPAVGE